MGGAQAVVRRRAVSGTRRRPDRLRARARRLGTGRRHVEPRHEARMGRRRRRRAHRRRRRPRLDVGRDADPVQRLAPGGRGHRRLRRGARARRPPPSRDDMNVYAAIALAALLADFAVARVADALNLHALGSELPPELGRVYDDGRLQRVRAYVRDRTRFGTVEATVDLLMLLVFWLAGGFGALDAATRALGRGPIATGVAFVGALAVGRAVVGLPFRWWSTFRIEARHGFNQTTPAVFWGDIGKGAMLAAVLGAPLLAAVLWLFTAAGERAWLWCWLVTACWTLALEFVAPTWIMPLFNRFAPLPAGALRDAILGYARAVDFPLEGVFVMDGSRRSTKANALFTGFGRHKRIALFDTLIDALDPGEVVAVVAHEVGHYKRRHVLAGTILAIVHAGVLFFLLSLVLPQ